MTPATSEGLEVSDDRTVRGPGEPSYHYRAEPLADTLARHRRAYLTKDRLVPYAVPATLVLLAGTFSVLKPQTFFTLGNAETILTTQSVLLVVALSLTVVLAAGDLDLSIGGMIGFTGVLVAWLTTINGIPIAFGLLLSLAAALLVGAINAVLIVKLSVNSLITTLAMGTLLDGLSTAFSNSETLGNIPSPVSTFANTRFLGVGIPFWYAIALLVLLWFVLGHTPGGRYVYFTGEGREAARLAGIQVDRIRMAAIVVSALGAWLAGLILLGQTGSAQAGVGDSFLLPAYAAVFLGAATIKLGRFNPLGSVVAVLVLAVGSTGLQLFGLANWVTEVFDAGVLIVAVAFAAMAIA